MDSARIGAAMRLIVGLPTATIDEPEHVADALDRFEQGMDFADALDLGHGEAPRWLGHVHCDFIKAAARIGLQTVAEP